MGREDGRVREVSRQSPGIDRGDSKLLRTVREERAVAAPFVPTSVLLSRVRAGKAVVRVENRVLRKVREREEVRRVDIRISFE